MKRNIYYVFLEGKWFYVREGKLKRYDKTFFNFAFIVVDL